MQPNLHFCVLFPKQQIFEEMTSKINDLTSFLCRSGSLQTYHDSYDHRTL